MEGDASTSRNVHSPGYGHIMTALRGTIRPRATPDETPGESTPITADGPDYDTAYTALQAQVSDTHLLLYVLVV